MIPTELKKLIREEFSLLKEIDFEKIYYTKGLLITDDNIRYLTHILSDIRSLPGVTIARVEEVPNQQGGSTYKSILHIKVDPYPYIKSPKFSHAQSQEIMNDVKERIQKIEGIVSIKFSSQIEIKDL